MAELKLGHKVSAKPIAPRKPAGCMEYQVVVAPRDVLADQFGGLAPRPRRLG